MLTMTKKPSTVEWTDVARARELLREAVEAKRALADYRPMGRLNVAAWVARFLELGGQDPRDLVRLRQALEEHAHAYPATRHVLHVATRAIAERNWWGPPADESCLSYLGRPFDNAKAELGSLGLNVFALLAIAAEDACVAAPEAFGSLNVGEHEREQRALDERATRTRAALAAIPETLRRGLAADRGILVDPRPEVDLDTRLIDYAGRAS